MGVSGFGPAPDSNLNEFERRLREIQGAEATQESSRRRKLTGATIALVGVALIGSALALKVGAPTLPKKTTDAPSNDIAAAQNLSGETAGRPADNSKITPSGAAPATPEVDAQAVEGLAPQASVQATDPEPARRMSGPPDGALVASQVSSPAERWSASGGMRPHARPASERMNRAVGATRPLFGSPAHRRGKFPARIVVSKTEAVIPAAAVETPSAPLPREASGAKDSRPISQSEAVPATPAAASKQLPNPLLRSVGDLLRAVGDLFAALALSARQAIDTATARPTGWSVQLGAPRSEAEANGDRTRLTAKYASALNGSTISERKAIVNGETVYRLRVVDLSKADAKSLCTRLKVDGGNCFIVK